MITESQRITTLSTRSAINHVVKKKLKTANNVSKTVEINTTAEFAILYIHSAKYNFFIPFSPCYDSTIRSIGISEIFRVTKATGLELSKNTKNNAISKQIILPITSASARNLYNGVPYFKIL